MITLPSAQRMCLSSLPNLLIMFTNYNVAETSMMQSEPTVLPPGISLSKGCAFHCIYLSCPIWKATPALASPPNNS